VNTKNIPKAVAVVGPTAAGKTKLGVEIAQKFNGEIISADSRQVFKYLDISTGKDLADYGDVPYHLIDILEPSEEISVADFQKQAFSVIGKILRRKKQPVIVGGSPFYVYAVTEGWKFPKLEKDEKLRKKLNKMTLQELRNILQKIDPAAFDRIDQKNPRRLIRAIEICTLSGHDFEHAKPVAQPRYKVLMLGIKYSNEELKERIKTRLDQRLNDGMIEEIQKIIKKKQASYADLERLGLEPRFIAYYLQEKINREQLEDLLLKNIYHFAKRQMTWFGKDKRIKWVDSFADAEKKVKRFLI